jgi:hypothetical protein
MAHTYGDLLPSDVSTDSYFFSSAISYSASDVSTDPSTILLSAADILSPMSLAFRSDTPVSMNSPDDEKRGSRLRRGSTTMSASSPSSTKPASPQSTMTKRQHALHELLSSERAYASDLALIKDTHIPLALGESLVRIFLLYQR